MYVFLFEYKNNAIVMPLSCSYTSHDLDDLNAS